MSRPSLRRAVAVLGLAGSLAVALAAPASALQPTPPSTPPTTVPARPTIAQVLRTYATTFDTNPNDFNVAAHLVAQYPDLMAAASKPGSNTVFMPTDYAFRRAVRTITGKLVIAEADLVKTVNLLGKDMVGRLIRYHVLKGVKLVYGQALQSNGKAFTTFEGGTLKVSVAKVPGLKVQRPFVFLVDKATKRPDAKITNGNLMASNGVIHVIDQVLLPIEL